jgi:anti-sigma regulatory factor (Ser/Thr protein kinase)
MSDTGAIVVSGPASPETVRVFRAVAASIAARAGMPIDAVDECKIVVDEAATMLLRAGRPTTLSLSLERSDARVRATVESDGDPTDWPGDRIRDWPWRVIEGLASSARCAMGETGPSVVFEMDRSLSSA